MSDLSAFARQIALPEVGAEGQARLAAAHVLVVGAGGLGCPVLTYLATAGVGRITVMDPDRIERTNLHRQPLYAPDDVGAPKADTAARVLRRLAPALEVVARAERLGASNAATAIAGADVVVDAADSFAVSYILSDACRVAGTVMISASALGTAGYVGGFCGPAPSLRAVFPDLPDRAATCASAGVMGPVVGLIGAAQAQMVLQQILMTAPPVAGQLLSFDMGRLQTAGFRFDTAEEPAAGFDFVGLHAERQPDRIVVDLRSTVEAPEPVTPDAWRIAPDALCGAMLEQLRQASCAGRSPHRSDRHITLACTSGLRAWQAAHQLRAAGFERLSLHAVQAP
ncbi:ThiF family adenylyltransferase [Epibacterium sp. Ofav1-8]|uniref:ThiF family adenylyltransferase n=1 Tax=Epibacterium sp. Ofav1-8 TaxID=2917735 RepID=UPI00351D8856